MKFFIIILIYFAIFNNSLNAQVGQAIKNATETFEQLPLLKGAIYSIYVVNAKTGATVFAKNEKIGLATASCLKVLTSISAFDMLGANYNYKTTFELQPNNTIYVNASGDPTLGSWRYKTTKPDTIINGLIKGLKLNKQNAYNFIINNTYLGNDKIGGATIWEDIGNYYGSVCTAFNWYENQTDAVFELSKPSQPTKFLQTKPNCSALQLNNFTTTGNTGTGDNSLTYFNPNSNKRNIVGTLQGEKNVVNVGLSVPEPTLFFGDFIKTFIPKATVQNGINSIKNAATKPVIVNYNSPNLSQIVYWFNKKSINLYGDALLRTMGKRLKGDGAYETSCKLLTDYIIDKKIGIENYEIKIFDGSGLSPQTRVTTHALVNLIQYAYKQPWYNDFYQSLPEYNGMKLKSGTINGTKGFTGVHTNAAGETFIVSMLVNNFNGTGSQIVEAMYNVLNTLK
jgi:serine-type D-Ala-D-Ala carboxypeptidase/endopeptidase (penicillin-binding protein 4)